MFSARARRLMVVLVGLSGSAAHADLFSPGELARSHASLEGLSNCTQCHVSGKQLSEEKCLDCHTELKTRVKAGEGFHGKLSGAERACETCHQDHQGREFQMIEWVPSKKLFPHEKTGWRLKGKHAKVACEKCHEPRLIDAQDIKAWMKAHPHQHETFLGLPTACSACHFDEHRGQLGLACEDCHNANDWKPAPFFNHSETDYALTGKHKRVACEKCHGSEADTTTPRSVFPAPLSPKSFEKFGDLAHDSCLDCHKDPHDGKFGERCESCHTTAGWKTVKDTRATRNFHDETRYPLRGKHAEVACQSCHGPWPGQKAKFKNMAFGACTDCHADGHEGQLVSGPKRQLQKCEGCHTVEGFLPPHFELADHQKTRYPLEGAHEAVACVGCHQRQEALAEKIPSALLQLLKQRRRRPLFSLAMLHVAGDLSRCETCHADVHAGQFKKDGAAAPCSKCHQLSSFSDVRFDHLRDSRFALTGRHASTACASCHLPGKVNGMVAVRYKPLETACSGCHADVHAGQFASKPGGATDCTTCHGTDTFKATLFRHAAPFTPFLLEGKHQKVACVKCHPDVKTSAREPVRKYLGVPKDCASCHADFHQGAFKGFLPSVEP